MHILYLFLQQYLINKLGDYRHSFIVLFKLEIYCWNLQSEGKNNVPLVVMSQESNPGGLTDGAGEIKG